MNKAELISAVSAATGESKRTTEAVINALNETIKTELKAGGEVVFVGIGKLSTASRKARTVRNPKGGADVYIPARIAPTFKSFKALKDALND